MLRQVLIWALVGTGVDMSAANFDTAIKETLEDVSEAEWGVHHGSFFGWG